MSEKVVGVVKVFRSATFRGMINERLYFTPARIVVARTSSDKGGYMFGVVGAAADAVRQTREEKKKTEHYSALPLEDMIKADKHNYAIPNGQVRKIELKKQWRGASIEIETDTKVIEGKKTKQKWVINQRLKDKPPRDDIPEYADVLRPIFGDRLTVNK